MIGYRVGMSGSVATTCSCAISIAASTARVSCREPGERRRIGAEEGRMRIKQIELTGFKSFMDRTVLELPAGVTAIVGPNGCGKSNIVDAIRWVLGEQSPKHLRGSAMEDVIFSGNGENGPLGMAEVALLLERDEADLVSATAGDGGETAE